MVTNYSCFVNSGYVSLTVPMKYFASFVKKQFPVQFLKELQRLMIYSIQIRSDNQQEVKFLMGTAEGGLNVQSDESVKEVIGRHSYKPECLNSGGGMFV